jgi:hypothetical protein
VESETVNQDVPEIEEPKPKNFFSRLGGIYFSPKETFGEIGGSPRVLVPILMLLVMGVLVGFALINILDVRSMAETQAEKMIAQGQMSQQQLDQTMPFMTIIMKIQIFAGYLINSLLIALIVAGFIKMFSALIGAGNRFKAIFSMALFTAMAIGIVHNILLILILYIKGSSNMDLLGLQFAVNSNLNGVLSSILGEDALPRFVMSLARNIDLFNIWSITLLAIGSAAVSRKLKTSTAAFWLGGAYAVYAIISAAILALAKIPGM